MTINNEEDFIEIIKYKSFKKIKKFFKINKINIEQLNYFEYTLYYLIKEGYSYDIIKFIIKQRHKSNKNLLIIQVLYYVRLNIIILG